MTTTNARASNGRLRNPTLAVVAMGCAIGCAVGCGELELDETAVSQSQDESTIADFHADGTIHGTDLNRHRLTGGRVELAPVDLRSTPIEAQVERGDGFDVHPGSGDEDGTFSIEGVPRGRSYWLRVGTNYYLTPERVVDIGVDALGRPDAIGATAGTSLVVDVDGLTPVTSGDDFQLEAPDAQIGFYSTASLTNAIAAGAPAPGDTALDGAVFPFAADPAAGTSQFPLIQASRGDALTLAQLTTKQVGSLSYQSLSRALSTSVEMAQGMATTVQGTMTEPPSFVTRVRFRQAAFEELADGIHPGSVPTGATMFLDASPGGRRVNLGTPDLAVVAGVPAGSGDQVLPLEYRNPYPASWPRFVVSSVSFQAPFVGVGDDGGPVPRQTASTVLSWELVGHDDDVTIAPVLSSVRDVSIDGQPATDQIQAAAASPVVTWERPRRGRPDAYVVRIVQVVAAAPFVVRGIGRLVVAPDVHRVRIPAGLLHPGAHYYFQVIAVASSERRRRGQLEILFVPPRAEVIDALSTTIRVESD